MPDTNAPAVEAAQPSPEATGSPAPAPETSAPQAPPAPKRVIWAGDPPTQPLAPPEGSSADAEQGTKAAVKSADKAPKALDPEIESLVESRVQKALVERDKKAEKALAEQQSKAEAAAAERTLNEIRALARAAKKGGPEGLEAAERLIAKQIELYGAEDTPQAQADLRATLAQEITATKWKEHAEAFGVDPQDEEFAKVPAEARLKGLNAVIVRKTGDSTLVEAMTENPAVKKHFEKVYASEIEAARNDGMAKGSAPKLDVGGANSGKPLSDSELDRAYYQDPKNAQLAKLWIAKERRLGRM